MNLCSCSSCKHMTVSMGFSSDNGPNKKGSEARAGGGARETDCSRANVQSHVMEIDIEFMPIEHPLEPPDEDRPLKCPMPNPSVPNSGGMRNERSIESFRKKRVELPVAYEEEMVISPEPPAVRKRYHAPTPEYAVPLLFGEFTAAQHPTNASRVQ
ncbi:uncharacterized protein [Aristolochia californica]|uniref:uncharacterized protein n=1 Tax=Aristolochia californica TaxID=171875 RepID=UPI0035DC6A7F